METNKDTHFLFIFYFPIGYLHSVVRKIVFIFNFLYFNIKIPYI
jgi:hypothetical protein